MQSKINLRNPIPFKNVVPNFYRTIKSKPVSTAEGIYDLQTEESHCRQIQVIENQHRLLMQYPPHYLRTSD